MSMHPTRNRQSAREYAVDCLAWHIDVPTSASFLAGSTLTEAIDRASDAYAIDLAHAENVATIPGLGLTARIAGTFVAVGTAGLFATLDIRLDATTMSTVAQIRQRGNDAILIGGWKGVRHIAEIVKPAAKIATHAA